MGRRFAAPIPGRPAWTLLLPCLALALGACAAPRDRAGAMDAAAAERQVRAASAAWDSAHNAQDLAALIALYDSAAVSMPYERPALEGRAAIEADFRAFFEGFTAEHRTTIVSLEIAGDHAIERGRYTLTIAPKAGGAGATETGKHLVVRRRVGERWVVQQEIWNTDAPVPGP